MNEILPQILIVYQRIGKYMFPIGKNSQVGWDLGNRMDRGYRFDAKWVCPMGSYAWGITSVISLLFEKWSGASFLKWIPWIPQA